MSHIGNLGKQQRTKEDDQNGLGRGWRPDLGGQCGVKAIAGHCMSYTCREGGCEWWYIECFPMMMLGGMAGL
ncbi:hypothetical protein L195_g015069 [Trifolium pratense]|uniref:Uncharacterized protein n=1 Tax=Trifolium pratense TaxID=57577 RepID=A0A2K3MMD4_TRIPR|nr:hypothetical protein L195_g015069 [Trifolium pratense]